MGKDKDDTWADHDPARAGTWADGDAPPDEPPRAPDHKTVPRAFSARYEETGFVLGVGGLGRVDLVRDRDLGREVARKELLVGTQQQRERFLREARVTAQLEHPGIVAVYELGEENGRPYYTMRRIRGHTLGQALAEARGLRARLGLLPAFAQACQAVAFAHSHGVVHRDLKPDNIMVGEFGDTLVVDWGLAKVATPGTVETMLTGAFPTSIPKGGALTRVGATMGTPGYMSPEQARGHSAGVDSRTDVWSLGAILFEILAGRPLFGDLHPDVIIERLAAGQLDPIDPALRDAPRDLVAIIKKALATNIDHRYEDAGALAADVARWQTGGLVDAYAYSFREVIGRMIRRNLAVFTVVALGGAALSCVGVLSFAGIRSERDRAVAAENFAAEREVEATGRLARSLSEAAVAALGAGDDLSARILALGSLDLRESPDARGALLAAGHTFPELIGAKRLGEPCAAPILTPQGGALCWGTEKLQIWEPYSNEPTSIPIRGASTDAWRMVAAPDGRHLFAIHYDGTPYLVDRATRSVAAVNASDLNSAVFLDAHRVVVTSEQQRIGTLDIDTGGFTWSTRQAVVRFDDLVPLGDGTVLVGSVVDPVRRWDPRTDTWTLPFGEIPAPMLAASADASVVLAGGGWGGSATPLRLIDHGVERELQGATARSMIALTADGARAIAASGQAITVWDGPEWQIRTKIPADSQVLGASMSADGERVLLTEADGDMRLWKLPPRAGRRPLDHGGTVWDVRPSDDGEILASAGNDGVLRVWSADSGEVLREVSVDPGGLGYLAVRGRDAVIATNTRGLVRVGLDDLATRWTLPFEGVVNDIQVAFGTDFLVGTTNGDVVRVSATGVEAWRVHVAEWVASVAPSPDGGAIVAAQDRIVRLGPDGTEKSSFRHARMSDIALPAPDGGMYLGELGAVTRLDAQGEMVQKLAGMHLQKMRGLALRDDLVTSADDSGRACVWTAAAFPLACWPAHNGTVWRVGFVPKRNRLVSCGADAAVRLWDLDLLTVPIEGLLDEAKARFGLQPGDGHVVEAP